MNDTLTTVDEQIRAFAAAVRAELSDLPAEDVDDLVEGLVGDLTDQAADSDDAFQLGDPAEYARELRTAAGLPEKSATDTRTPLHIRVSARFGRIVGRIRRTGLGAWLTDFLVALRPVWWVLRGFALYAIAGAWFNAGPRTLTGQHSFESFLLAWALLIGLVVVSVQWGRDRWLPNNWLRHIRTVASFLVVIGLPLGWVAATVPTYVYADTAPTTGLLLDGAQIGNLFVYDASGELIDGAQIFTDDGTPLDLFGAQSSEFSDSTYRGWWNGEDDVTVPFINAQNRPVWNLYPLDIAPFNMERGEVDKNRAKAAKPPFAQAPTLVEPSAAPTPTPTPTPTPVTPTEPTP